jgi:glutamate dehydrogenase/leucine dehydrogenase
VGSGCAKLLKERGAKIIAVSTAKGAIYNENGLNLDSLIDLRVRYKDDFVNNTEEKRIKMGALLCLDADILITAALTYTINPGNRERVRAKIISCAANAAMDDDTYKVLHDKGIVVIPDMVANCGGVLGSFLERSMRKEDITAVIRDEFSTVVGNLIAKEFKENRSMNEIVSEIAAKRFAETKAKEERKAMNRFVAYAQMQVTRLIHRFRQQRYRKDIFGDLIKMTS